MTAQNYAHQILKNRSFKGLNLTGADFSGSDLRGCDFTGATLVGANFTGVRTGQSDRQINTLIVAAIIGPAGIIVLSLCAGHILENMFGDRFPKVFPEVLQILMPVLFFFRFLFRDTINRITLHFRRTSNFLGITFFAFLCQFMALFTILLVIVSLLTFVDGSGFQGLVLLAIAVFFAIVTRWIFKGVIQSISSSCGTSFRKANLTDANLSRAVVKNTDFSLAILTRICIFEWRRERHNQFADVYCEYVYLEPTHQKRHPAESKFRQEEVEAYLMTTNGRSF